MRRGILLNPNLGQKAQPILAHHFADLRFRPACVLHRGGQIGKVTDSAHPRRVHDLAAIPRQPCTEGHFAGASVKRLLTRLSLSLCPVLTATLGALQAGVVAFLAK
jgi:hypothetical protein